jgi:hypothetical protein
MNRRRGFLLLAAGLTLAAAPAVAQGFDIFPTAAPTAGDAVRQWVSAVDATPQWRAQFQSLAEDGKDGVVIRYLTLGSEPDGVFQVQVETLTIRGYAAAGGGFTATAVEADRARIAAGPFSFTLSGTKLSNLAVPALADITLDTQRPFTSAIRAYGAIARMRLENGRIDRLQLDQQNAGIASAVSYQNVTLGRLADGRLNLLTAGPVTMASPAPEGLVRLSIDRIESRGMDLEAAAHAFDPGRYANGVGDGQWRPALAYGAYRNVAIEALGLKVTIGTLSVENLRLRQPPRSFAPLFDGPATGVTLPPQEETRLAADHSLGFLSSMAAGQFGFRDLDIVGTGFSRFRVGSFNMHDVSLDSVGEVRVDDVSVAAAGQASFDLGRFALGRIVLPRADAIRTVIETEMRGGNSDLSSLFPQIGYVDIRGARLAMPDSGDIAIDRFRLDLGSYVGQVPTAVALDTSGISLDRRLLRGIPEARLLGELGYDRLAFDSSLRLEWQESASALRLQDFSFSADKIGRVNANLDFGGLTREEMLAPDRIGGMLDRLTFGGGKIEIVDDSALDRVFEAQAARLKVEPATLKKRASDFIPALTKMLANPFLRGQFVGALPGPLATVVNALTPMLNDPALSDQVVKALQGFIDAKGTITVWARPANPVPLGTLGEAAGKAPETLPSLLSVEITKSP